MKHLGTVILETERLILRRFTLDDAEAMFRNWASDAEVTTYLTWPSHSDISVSQSVINSWIPLYENLLGIVIISADTLNHLRGSGYY